MVDKKFPLVEDANTRQQQFMRLCMLSGSIMNSQEETEITTSRSTSTTLSRVCLHSLFVSHIEIVPWPCTRFWMVVEDVSKTVMHC